MINGKMPGGLFGKLEADVSHIAEDINGGLVKVVFSYNGDAGVDSDLTQTSCGG